MPTRILISLLLLLLVFSGADSSRAQSGGSSGFTYLGDLNEDDKVNIFDLLAMLGTFSTGPSSERVRVIANVDKSDNGKVDIFDLLALLKMMKSSDEPEKIYWGPPELAAIDPLHALPGDTVTITFNGLTSSLLPQILFNGQPVAATALGGGRAAVVLPDSFVGALVTAVLGEDILSGKILNLRNPNPPVIAGCRIFPEDNPWNQPVEGFPVHPNSDKYIAKMNPYAQLHPDMGSNPNYGIPFITVGEGQTVVPLSFEYADECDPGPYPIPDDAPIEGGSSSSGDRHILVIDSSACMLYETWSTYPEGDGWRAGSGAIFDLASNAQRPDGWTSSDAAGLPVLAGLVRYEEVAAGEVNHAIRFTVVNTLPAYIYPASHRASNKTDPELPPMGLRVRLKASYDISRFSGQARVIARALQIYGMIVADNGSDWFFTGASSSRWNDSELEQLKSIRGTDFEVVDAEMMEVTGRGERLNVRPGVDITFPSQDTTLAAADSITITANAWDNDGSVALVEFFDGETKLGDGELIDETYQLAWTLATAGEHVLTARATDLGGAVNTSWAIRVTIAAATR